MAEGANHFAAGTMLPAVLLRATDGSDVLLAAVPGRSIVVVYPWTGRPGEPNPPGWDDIPGAHGSTPELEGFRDLHAAFTERGVTIFGLSSQTSDYQREMAGRLRLPFLVLSDADGLLAAALRLPSFTAGDATYMKRLTLVLSDGLIESVVYPVADPAGHASDMLAMLAQITSSSVSSTE
jgi:peroxiredoxin